MRLLSVVLLIVIAGCAVAADPAPPIKVGEGWKGPNYEFLRNVLGEEESWDYEGKSATLLIIRAKCSPCEPVGDERVQGINDLPNDVAILVQNGKYTAEFALSTEPRHHLITSYVTASDTHIYHLQLTALDSVSAREMVQLQQDFLRMVQGWQPE